MALQDDLERKSDEELLRAVWGMTRENPIGVAVERLLLARAASRQADAGHALVRATKQLARATWILAVITRLMLLGILQVYLSK